MPVGELYDGAIQGGYLDDVVVDITAKVETRTSKNSGNDYTALFMEWEWGEDGDKQSREEIVYIGSADDFAPSEDGRDVLKAHENAPAWRRNSAIYRFITDLVNAGYTKDEVNSKPLADLVDGAKAHVLQRPTGGKYVSQKDGKEHDETKPYIDKVIAKPWENKAKAAPKGKTKAAAAAASSDAVDEDAIKAEIADLVMTGVANAGDKGYNKARLSGDVIKHFKDNPKARQAAVKLLKPDFLGSIDGVTFDGTNFTM